MLEVRRNGEWLAQLTYADVVRLGRITHRGAAARARRLREALRAHRSRSRVSELLYPLMQAYDSVAIEADVELGGTDQLYNLLTGRDVMEAYGLEPQVVVTYRAALGLDGVKMISKSRRQQHPAHDAARGDVRARRCRSPTRAARRAGISSSPAARPGASRCSGSSSSRAGSSRAGTARRPRARPRSTSRGSCARGEAPDEIAGGARRERRSAVHLPAILAGALRRVVAATGAG